MLGQTRKVTCYHCGAGFAVSAKAVSASCAACYKHVGLVDQIFTGEHRGTKVQTCGLVLVEKKARVIVPRIDAAESLTVLGRLEVGSARTLGKVLIARGAVWKGDCTAREVVIEPGALVQGGKFTVGLDAVPGVVAAAA